MATSIYRYSDVSSLIRVGYSSAVTPTPPTPAEDPRVRFARTVREGREERGWNQDQLADAAGVSRPTIQRWETAKTGTPDPENARRVFLALGLDPRYIPVVLGYVTAEEMGLPPRVISPTAEEALAILEDPSVPAAQKAEWLRYLRYVTQEAAKPPRKVG